VDTENCLTNNLINNDLYNFRLTEAPAGTGCDYYKNVYRNSTTCQGLPSQRICLRLGQCINQPNNKLSETFGYRYYYGTYVGVSFFIFLMFTIFVTTCILLLVDGKKKKRKQNQEMVQGSELNDVLLDKRGYYEKK